MARPKHQGQIDDVVGRVVDIGIEAMLGKVDNFVQQLQSNQVASNQAAMEAIPTALRRSSYKCACCHKDFPFNDVAVINDKLAMLSTTGDGFATCKPCYKLIWNAGNEKVTIMREGFGTALKALYDQARAAAASKQEQSAQRPPAEPPGQKPWETLGVDVDATIDEVKKAYRKQAATWHPDKFAAGPQNETPAEAAIRERNGAQARARFDQIQRAYNVMMKVRQAAT